jgi:hypothetical protein
MKPFYFFHIPKTSGRFFVANVVLVLENELLANGIQYGPVLKGFGHRSFRPVDTEDILSLTFLREPVARSISHYLHIYNNVLTDDITNDKIKFLDFLYHNSSRGIVNYQTKYIAYNGSREIVDIDDSDFITEITEQDLALVQTRLSKIDYVFNVENQSYELTKKFVKMLYSHYGITPTTALDRINPQFPPIINPQSKILLDSLTASEVQEVQDIMSIDMNLYSTVQFTSF